MIDRRLFTPDGTNPPFPVPVADDCTIPTEQMAYLLAELLNTDGDVLEIGTGSGYQTAVLAEKCRVVVSIEMQPMLHLRTPLPKNTMLILANGLVFDTAAEYDAVLVTFGIENVMPVWIKQLKIGGRLVVPIRTGPSCRICVYEKVADNNITLLDVPVYASFTNAIVEEQDNGETKL